MTELWNEGNARYLFTHPPHNMRQCGGSEPKTTPHDSTTCPGPQLMRSIALDVDILSSLPSLVWNHLYNFGTPWPCYVSAMSASASRRFFSLVSSLKCSFAPLRKSLDASAPASCLLCDRYSWTFPLQVSVCLCANTTKSGLWPAATVGPLETGNEEEGREEERVPSGMYKLVVSRSSAGPTKGPCD